MLICPTVFLKMKRECTLVQGKCNIMVTSAMRPFHQSKNKNSKNSINLFSQSQYKLCDLISDDVTLSVHSHAEVTVVTRYLRQSVSCDVLWQRPPNYVLQKRFVNNKKMFNEKLVECNISRNNHIT